MIRGRARLGLALTFVGAALACTPSTPEPARELPGAEPLASEPMVIVDEDPGSLAFRLRTLEVDGSAASHRLAVQTLIGLREDRVGEAAPKLLDLLARVLAEPELDMVEGHEGELRHELCQTLAELGSEQAVPDLIELLEAPEASQPKLVYVAAIKALTRLPDPAAVEPLLAVQFRVADRPSTTSIPELAIEAIAAIGEPALPALLDALAGRSERVNALALEHGVEVEIVQMTALRILGVVGSSKASKAILASMPQLDCVGTRPPAARKDDVGLRAFAANALGFIADPATVQPLCACRHASHDPTDLYEITAALGRIGGDEAFACLEDIASKGAYDRDAVVPGFEFEIRSEAVRWMILAAPPAKFAKIGPLIDRSRPEVIAAVDQQGWRQGAALLDACAQDRACYERALGDATRPWFEREVAAFNYARLSDPGDLEAAANLAKAFKTRDPDARINIAWLAGKLADSHPCPACIDALEAVMKAEALTKDATMQGAWLTARQAIAKLGTVTAAARE